MEPNRDIVITGLQSWHIAMGGNIVNMAKEFSKNHRVLFVNYAVDRLTILRQRDNPVVKKYKENKKDPSKALEQVSENLWVYTPDVVLESVSQIKPRKIFDYVNGLNMKRFGKIIKQTVDQLGFKDFILFTDSDFFRSFNLKETLKPEVMVYYIRDNMIKTQFFRHHGARMEEAMIRKADVVVTNSEFLGDYARKYNPQSYYVGQGCDSELFNPETVPILPEDIQEIRDKYSSVIGYVGALRSIRIDLKLLEAIAGNRPDWAFVFVGWEDEPFQKSSLHGMKNVFFLGARKEKELPAYIMGFDVALNPQVYNELTRGNYPRKIDEYLAMGKPVVATKTEAMEMFSDSCYLGRSPEDYVQLIEEAMVNDSHELKEQRIQLGKLHSWEKNITEIFNSIERVRPK